MTYNYDWTPNYAEIGHLGVYGNSWCGFMSEATVKPVETFNCKSCQGVWREEQEEQEECVCIASNIVWWLGSLNICATVKYPSSILITILPLSLLSPLAQPTFHFPMYFSTRWVGWEGGGVNFAGNPQRSWQTAGSRCGGKGRLVLKFPLITFSPPGGSTAPPVAVSVSPESAQSSQDIQWASLASSTVTQPGSNCSLSPLHHHN